MQIKLSKNKILIFSIMAIFFATLVFSRLCLAKNINHCCHDEMRARCEICVLKDIVMGTLNNVKAETSACQFLFAILIFLNIKALSVSTNLIRENLITKKVRLNN